MISVDGHEMFLYAADRAQAEAAQQVVERIASEHGWQLDTELRRWHPVAEIWEDPDNPEPRNADEQRTEEEIRNAGERRDSAEDGYPAIEVRVTCGSRHEAVELSERLDHEGIANVHRWSWVLIGARDEETATRSPSVCVASCPVPRSRWSPTCVPSGTAGRGNPFAWLGGLAG